MCEECCSFWTNSVPNWHAFKTRDGNEREGEGNEWDGYPAEVRRWFANVKSARCGGMCVHLWFCGLISNENQSRKKAEFTRVSLNSFCAANTAAGSSALGIFQVGNRLKRIWRRNWKQGKQKSLVFEIKKLEVKEKETGNTWLIGEVSLFVKCSKLI